MWSDVEFEAGLVLIVVFKIGKENACVCQSSSQSKVTGKTGVISPLVQTPTSRK